MDLYYLGPQETFSHRTATHMARPGDELVPCQDFQDIFQRLAVNPGASAIVPFENTTRGPVTEVMDLLVEYPHIVATDCCAVPVHQHLLTRDLTTNIQKICSKEEALAQCRSTLRQLFPGIPLVAVSSTAEAARQASLDPTIAAVAGATTAKRYGLVLRRFEIQDVKGNTTRFFRVESRQPQQRYAFCSTCPTGHLPPTHALLYIRIEDRPGSPLTLLERVKPFDLTFIQSRPLPNRHWEYGFYLEVLTGNTTIPLATLIANLQSVAKSVRLLGTYTIRTHHVAPSENATTALSSLRAMIIDIDREIARAIKARKKHRLNASLYAHNESVSIHDIAQAIATENPKRERLLRRFYLNDILPNIVEPGEDDHPRDTLHDDADILTALMRRCRFSSKVIARKRIELAPTLRAAADTQDPEKVEAALLNQEVEDRVIANVGKLYEEEGATPEQVETLRRIYREKILPLSRLIQVYEILNND
jgi:chorismate mutase/prephenate dehydratase